MSVPIFIGDKLSSEQCPTATRPVEMEDMTHVPYACVVSGLMYAMIYTKPNNAQVVQVFNHLWLIINMSIQMQ